MRKEILFTSIMAITVLCIQFSCQKEISQGNQRPENFLSSKSSNNNGQGESKKIYVNNIAQLYAAINNPDNAGNTIVLSPGIYLLNPAFPNGGRLELLNDMSLVGQAGRSEDVIIDVSGLPNASYLLGPGRRTGAIRVGNGNNEIEWLTVQNTAGGSNNIRSLIQTDIALTPVALLRIAHCILKGSSIGLNVINRDPVNNGRIVEATVEDNEIMNNNVPLFGSGIQIQNSSSIADAVIKVALRRNYIHGNKAGMLAFNSSSQQCVMEIKSYDGRIENNGMGLMLNSGFCESASVATLNNSLTFDAFTTTIQNNLGSPAPPFLYPACGVYVAGGEAFPPFAPPGTAHHNTVEISFHGCEIDDNAGSSQIIGLGAHSFHPSLMPVGTYNSTKIYLYGLSNNVPVSATASFPVEPAGTNTIAVYR